MSGGATHAVILVHPDADLHFSLKILARTELRLRVKRMWRQANLDLSKKLHTNGSVALVQQSCDHAPFTYFLSALLFTGLFLFLVGN